MQLLSACGERERVDAIFDLFWVRVRRRLDIEGQRYVVGLGIAIGLGVGRI